MNYKSNCNHPATDDCTHRRWYIQSGVVLAIKTKGALIIATLWMQLGNITLSEKSQTQKRPHYCMIPFV